MFRKLSAAEEHDLVARARANWVRCCAVRATRNHPVERRADKGVKADVRAFRRRAAGSGHKANRDAIPAEFPCATRGCCCKGLPARRRLRLQRPLAAWRGGAFSCQGGCFPAFQVVCEVCGGQQAGLGSVAGSDCRCQSGNAAGAAADGKVVQGARITCVPGGHAVGEPIAQRRGLASSHCL